MDEDEIEGKSPENESVSLPLMEQLKQHPAAQSAEDLPFRTAPHNIEAEQALLGAILVNNDAFDRVSTFLDAGHFYDPLHGRIYEICAQLIQAGKRTTPITLKTFFENEEPVGPLTVPQYLGRLAANATTIINAFEYGQTIYDLSVRRSLILIGEDIVNTAYDSPIDMPPTSQIEEAEQRLFSVAEAKKYGAGFSAFSSALTDAIEMANEAYKRDGGLSGRASGLKDLDGKMGGLQSSDLIVLAGRPAMGKTSLATNLAFNVARDMKNQAIEQGIPVDKYGGVGFFSLEMSSEQLATRIIAEQSEISSEKIRRGMIDEHEFHELVRVSQELQELPLYIDDTGGISIAQLTARARKLKRQHGLGLIVVDYLQLLTGSSSKAAQGRVQEITEITTGLKALAKELEVPIIALSQLSRQVENRDDKRPQLADLRESGSIEQDADIVLFVFREEYYVQKNMPREDTPEFEQWQYEMERVHGLAEVIVAKQRHGATGAVKVKFDANVTRFSDYIPDDHLPERME